MRRVNNFTVIFDMDGVIVDSERVYQEIERSMYDEIGIPVSKEEHATFMGTAERSMWKILSDKYGIDRPVKDLVQEERERFITRLEDPVSIPLMKGLITLLKDLKSEQIPCWIASSSSSEIIAKVIEINKLGDFYKGFVSGDDVTESKPSPEIFLKAASLEGTEPSKCLVLEDSVNGIKAARAAGMPVVALRHPDNDPHTLTEATIIIDSLSEVNSRKFRKIIAEP
jgi:beta-phosphoglucomutase